MANSPDDIPFNSLKCTRCKQVKHRRRFVPMKGITTRYDYWCSTCRKQVHTLPETSITKRVIDGLTTPKTAARVKARKKENHIYSLTEGRKIREAKENEASWKPLLKAIAYMRTHIMGVQFMCEDQKEYDWAAKALRLVDKASTITEQRSKEGDKMPSSYRAWYDASREVREELRTLIDEYPRGASEAPLVII